MDSKHSWPCEEEPCFQVPFDLIEETIRPKPKWQIWEEV